MTMNPDQWAWLEKVGIVVLLGCNIGALLTLTRLAFKSLQNKEWVPGWAYHELVVERDRLRAENDAYRSVTLRAIAITTKVIGSEG